MQSKKKAAERGTAHLSDRAKKHRAAQTIQKHASAYIKRARPSIACPKALEEHGRERQINQGQRIEMGRTEAHNGGRTKSDFVQEARLLTTAVKLANKAKKRAQAAAAAAMADVSKQWSDKEQKCVQTKTAAAQKAKREADVASQNALQKVQATVNKTAVRKAVRESKIPVYARLVQRFSDQVVVRVRSFRREQEDFELMKAYREEDEDMEALLDILRTEFLIENGREPNDEELEDMITYVYILTWYEHSPLK